MNPTKCWFCQASDPKKVVAEVWFDMGQPNMRFCSTQDHKGPKPHVCSKCYGKREGELATVVLNQARAAGRTGPLIPTRWWVRYEGESSFESPDFRPFGGYVGVAPP